VLHDILSISVSGWVFEAYVDWLLAPALRPGNILVMDNLSSHKSPAVLEKIEATGAEIRFLPPCRPDLNPIEQIFSKIKAYLCRLAVRTERNAIAKAIETVTPVDCLNCFRNSGYIAHTFENALGWPTLLAAASGSIGVSKRGLSFLTSREIGFKAFC
jgi:transposase